MRPRIRIIHKGFALVAIPLCFGIIFILSLCVALYTSDKTFKHELLLKDAMIFDDVVARRLFSARICAISYYICKDRYYEQAFHSNIQECSSACKTLNRLLKDERSLQRPMHALKEQIMSDKGIYMLIMHAPFEVNLSDVFEMFGMSIQLFFTARPVYDVMDKLQLMSNREAEATLQAMSAMQFTLASGLVLSLSLTLALALFFCLNITNRLLLIVNNTIRLAQGLPLSAPIKGSDEIAELDQFLYKTAAEIRQLEKFKKEMIGVVSMPCH